MKPTKEARIASGIVAEVMGGAPAKMSSAELAAGIERLEARLSRERATFERLDADCKAQEVQALGDAEGMAKLDALQTEADSQDQVAKLLARSLEGARVLIVQKRAAELKQALTFARAAVEEKLNRRAKVAAEIEDHLEAIAAKLGELHTLGQAAINAGRARLNDATQAGFRLSGGTGQGFRPEQVQHELNLALAWRVGPLWAYDRMPLAGGARTFEQLTHAWHLQLLDDFDMAYRRERPSDGGLDTVGA